MARRPTSSTHSGVLLKKTKITNDNTRFDGVRCWTFCIQDAQAAHAFLKVSIATIIISHISDNLNTLRAISGIEMNSRLIANTNLKNAIFHSALIDELILTVVRCQDGTSYDE